MLVIPPPNFYGGGVTSGLAGQALKGGGLGGGVTSGLAGQALKGGAVNGLIK